MANIATGVFKRVSIKRQATQGVIAPAGPAGSARYMRRTSSTLNLAKASYGSAEILVSQQRRDFRHGVRSVAGSISGELSVGGYQLPFEGLLRKQAVAGATTAAGILTITIASSGAGTRSGTLTRSAGDFIAEGFKVGEVVAATGAGAGANTQNLLVTAVSATVLTVRTLNGTDIVAVAAGSAITIAMRGKKTFIPALAHTRDYFTIEHFFADIGESERFIDSVFTGATITLPATGLATVEFPVMGLDMATGNAEYFTAPAAAPTGPILAAVNGAIVVNGLVVANVTGLTITIGAGSAAPGGIVGQNTDADIFHGTLVADGSVTALFTSVAMRDLFINETEFTIVGAFTGDNSPLAGVVSFILPRCKFNGADKDDVQTGLTQTLPFAGLENTASGVHELSTIVIQDSAFI